MKLKSFIKSFWLLAMGQGADTNNANFSPQLLFASKKTHNYFVFYIKKIQKNLISLYLVHWQPCVWLKQPPKWALNTIDVNFSMTFWILILYMKYLTKLKIGPLGSIGRHPHLLETACIVGPPNTWVGNFFHRKNSLSICILYRKLVKEFEIGTFWANWQTLFVKTAHNMGPQIQELAIFHKTDPPFNFNFMGKIVEKF